jgi:hypothetical protein
MSEEVRYVELKEHPGYRIGSDGTVQSDILRGCKTGRRTGIWKDLKLTPNLKHAYLHVDLRTGRRRNARVNLLVIEAFVGPCPPGMECRHLNGVRTDNRVENLAWGTRSQNMQDAVRHGTIKRGERQELAKLTEDSVREIRTLAAAGIRQSHLVRKYGVASSVISTVVNGKAWKHVEATP